MLFEFLSYCVRQFALKGQYTPLMLHSNAQLPHLHHYEEVFASYLLLGHASVQVEPV